MELPKGPVQPVWRDGVVLAVLFGLWTAHGLGAYKLPAFLVLTGYSLPALCSMAITGFSFPAFAWLFGIGVLIRSTTNTPMFYTVACCLLVFVVWRLRHSFQSFPWEGELGGCCPALPDALNQISYGQAFTRDKSPFTIRLDELNRIKEPSELLVSNWPLLRSWAIADYLGISYAAGISVSLLLGFYHALIPGLFPDTNIEELRLGTNLLLGVLILVRIGRYAVRAVPPISIAGRIATKNLLIPGYDKIFVAPAVAAATIFLLPDVLAVTNIPNQYISSIVVTAVTGVLINAGPNLRNWRLTGAHRIGRDVFVLEP